MTDMRCGYNRIMEIVRTVYGRDPYDGDVYFYMSKNQRTVRMVNIDNSEAERNIRPMTIERSNSKSFGSHEGVEISAVYHTIIATCKAQAVSVCEYLKQFFTACVNGRTDYENLTPMMLCQPVK